MVRKSGIPGEARNELTVANGVENSAGRSRELFSGGKVEGPFIGYYSVPFKVI